MNTLSENHHKIPADIKDMPGFTPDLYRDACRLALNLQADGKLNNVGEGIYTAKTMPEVVDALHTAKVKARVKKITSEELKFG